ncbi:MAG TPA: hypothetical protein VFW02_00495 [Candidatus Limnocylindrales bacterium]|nr:hypothetical protein [Candidatus Limnocylindrales bacterium]
MIEILLQAEGALSLGLLDRAEILYRQVAIADPRNSIAVVGLARVALERGDEAGALAQASRALAIDAENAAAQRIVQRLQEVLGYRGAQAPEPPSGATTTPAAAAAPMADTSTAHASTAHASAPPEPATSPTLGRAPESPVAAEPGPPRRRSLVDRLLHRR